jgi:long-chain acyl-CoA synthetase
MTEGMAKNIRRAFPCAEIYCGYGLSETSPRVAYLSADLFDQKPTCAGLPLASVKVRIVRENGQDAAKGEIGEVLVKGPNVMLGYFDDPERTKAIVKNGWLYTGDLGLMDGDGMLTIKGRKDDMIIRAGMNIYPAEIENALSSDQRIGDIQAYGYEKNGTQEIGLIVSGEFSSVEEVMTLCRASLPSYQLPSKIELVEKTEILTGGKRRRKRL